MKGIKDIYKPLDLIEDLRTEIKKIVPKENLYRGRITDKYLSDLLGQNKDYLRDWVKAAIKKNPDYLIALDRLNEFKNSLETKFKDRSKKLIDLIEKYQTSSDLPYSNRFKIYEFHPDIKLDFFKEINSKEKAYWLGFIYADAYVIRKGMYYTHFGIDINISDEILINRFGEAIGLNLEHKKYYERKSEITGKISKHVLIEFSNREFVNNLRDKGIKEKKSRIIELPEFNNRNLNLAFLLGYFDGDGTAGRTTITSASIKFLQQIKEKYNLNFDIREVVEKGVGTNNYRISLGGQLFNEMMENYKYSLKRKRKIFDVRRFGLYEQFKEMISKEELKKLVWEKPISKIAQEYNVQRYHVSQLCDEWKIKRPEGFGHWNQKEFLNHRDH